MGTDSTPDSQDPSIHSPEQDQDVLSRADMRIETKGVKCTTDGSTVRVADLTGQGMRLAVSPSGVPAVGETKTYTFTDKETDHTLSIEGIVRWVRKGSVLTRKSEVGIEFIDLPPSYRDALTLLAVQGELHLSNDMDSSEDQPEEHHSTQQLHINLYDILGVSSYASDDAVNLALRKLVKQWHPDRNDDPEAPARFEELHKAYSVLRDPTLRERYDQRFGPDQAAA